MSSSIQAHVPGQFRNGAYERNDAENGDPNTLFLLQSNAADNTNEFIDTALPGRAFNVGNMTHQDTDPKFGISSMYTTGAVGVSLETDSAVFDWSQDFTVDLWYKWVAHGAGVASQILGVWNDGATNMAWLVYHHGDQLWIGTNTNANGTGYTWFTQITNYAALTTRTAWHHLAIELIGSTMHTYINGTLVDSQVIPAAIFASTNPLAIGNFVNEAAVPTQETTAYYDEVRISNIARYNGASFTPETQPYVAY